MSSSGSWAGAAGGGAAPAGGAADIIDLDRFMRGGGVRPGATRYGDKCERLVVDAGGIGRKPPSERSNTSVESAARERDKRYSHDSGLSDGSYVRRRHREHRRGAAGGSLHRFRAACEQALRDQQEQIARVAQICERLTVRRAPPSPRIAAPPPPRTLPPPRSADSSELSSSSRSTRDQRRRDKRRTAECKTYKIIMSKLDELNQMFAARGRAPPAPAPRVAPSPAPARRSSRSSVSVSDKLVSTEPALEPHTTRLSVPATRPARAPREAGRGAAEARWSRLAALRTLDLDIAPRRAAPGAGTAPGTGTAPASTTGHVPRLNVATESVVQCESSSESGSSGAQPDSPCKFDLDDPVHLYAQAKRLQALHARTRGEQRAGAGRARGGGGSLCALCRGYWRALARCLAGQLCRADHVY